MPKINDPKELQEWVDNTETILADMKVKAEQAEKLEEENKTLKEEVTNLQKQVSDLGNLIVINKNAWHETDPKRKADYDFGKWLSAVQKRDFKTLVAFNTKISLTARGRDAKIIPLSEATKSMLRNVSADGQKGEVGNLLTEGFKADLGTPLTGDATGTDAQYLVPQTIYQAEIIKTIEEDSEIIPKFSMKTMTGRLLRYPTEGTKFAFTFVTNEVTSKTEQNPTWSYKDIEAETFAGWVGVTDELMEDTFADIGGELAAQARDAYIVLVETQLLDGSGSPFTGVLRDGSTNVNRLGSTSILNAGWEDLQNTIQKLTTRGKRRGAMWMMHPTLWDIFMSEKDAQGRYHFDLALAGPRTAKGYPVLLSDNMPDTSDDAADTAFIAFGNPGYVYFGIRMGLEIKYFTETMYAVTDDENFFRIRTRLAGIVAIPANFAVIKTAVS